MVRSVSPGGPTFRKSSEVHVKQAANRKVVRDIKSLGAAIDLCSAVIEGATAVGDYSRADLERLNLARVQLVVVRQILQDRNGMSVFSPAWFLELRRAGELEVPKRLLRFPARDNGNEHA